MNEDKNITHNDMRFFQNDLLNDMKKLELQLDGKIAGINQILLTKMGDYDSKFTKIFENISELISQMAERKYDNDRVEELLKIRNKFSDQIIESQSRISIIDKTLENALFKYDKIILDNLNVPGLIGVGCKFKNCASYFKFWDNEYQTNQKYKEEGVNNLRSLSDKVETRLKKQEGDISQILQNVNHICDVKFEQIFQKMEERNLSTENLLATNRIENSKYAQDLIQASTDLKIQWDKLENIKNEIYGKFDHEVDICKKLVLTTNTNFKKIQDEFKVFKQRFSQLTEYLKDVKNMGKNYREMAKNIDFSKKQKLQDDYDLGKYDEIGENVKDYIKSPSPRRPRNSLTLKFKEDEQNENNEDNKSQKGTNNNNNITRKNFNKRASLSPSPRKTAIYMKKKKMTELEKINKIAKEGNQRLSNVFTFKNKLKEINDPNNNGKKNENDLKRKNELNNEEEKKEKKVIKTLLKKKTIVTENNIDLNFDMNQENDKENSKEDESENSSISSNFSLSSIISLKKIGDDTKDDKAEKESKQSKKDETKENKKLKEENNKNKEKEKEKGKLNLKEKDLFSDKEDKNIEKSFQSSKSSFKEKVTSTDREKDKEESHNSTQKNIKNEPRKSIVKNLKTEGNIINKKKEISKTPFKPFRIKGSSKNKKGTEDENKEKNKIKNKEKNLKANDSTEKSNTINQSKEKKSFSPILTKRTFNLEKIDSKSKNKFANNKSKNILVLNNDSKNDITKDKVKKDKPVSVFNKQIKQAMNEYTNKNTNQLNKANSNKLSTEVTFPQIKTTSNDINKKDNSQSQILKLMSNTSRDNKKIKNKLIFGNNAKPFVYNALLTNTNQRLFTNNDGDNKEPLNISKDNNESKDNIEIKEKKEEKCEVNEKSEIKEKIEVNENKDNKEKKVIIINDEKIKEENKSEIKEKEVNTINQNELKENINMKNLFNSLYDDIKEIKDITKNNNINKEKENINNKNAFLTSLNNINNNYNYYYNNDNIHGNNFRSMINAKQRKNIDDETIKKFNNEIDFINGNIKLVNHRITTLENRYQLILTQLNNIFKTVSTYYHHHKKKSDIHHTMRIKNKLGTIRKNMDYEKEGEILDDKKLMLKLKDIYNDDYENNEDYRINIPNDEYNKTLRRIEPFLIKKFKKI